MTSTHFVAVTPAVFRDIAQDRQHALCLTKDRGLLVGDHLVMREQTLANGRCVFTGAWTMRKVTAVIEGAGIGEGYAVYSFNRSAENERATVVMKRQLGLAETRGIASESFFRQQDKRERARREKLREQLDRVARARSRGSRTVDAVEECSGK